MTALKQTGLKERLRSDLTTAMKARDEVRTRALRMALTAVTKQEVSGATARELTDDEVVEVLAREAKLRRESAGAFEAAGREGQAAAERAAAEVIDGYLPAQLGDEELTSLVAAAVAETGADGMGAMGKVMKLLAARVAGRVSGARLAAEVRRQLAG